MYTYHFWLKSVFLLENGESVKLKGKHIVSVVLHNPNGQDKSVETILSLPLEDESGTKTTLLKANELYSTKDVSFHKKELFKRALLGHATATATISVSKSPNKLRPILKGVLKGVIIGAGGTIGGPGGAILAEVVTSLADTVLKDDELKDKVVILGEGDAAIFDGMPSGDLHFNLSCPEKIEGPVENTGEIDAQGLPVGKKKFIPEGAPLAHIVVGVERIEPDPTQPAASPDSKDPA